MVALCDAPCYQVAGLTSLGRVAGALLRIFASFAVDLRRSRRAARRSRGRRPPSAQSANGPGARAFRSQSVFRLASLYTVWMKPEEGVAQHAAERTDASAWWWPRRHASGLLASSWLLRARIEEPRPHGERGHRCGDSRQRPAAGRQQHHRTRRSWKWRRRTRTPRCCLCRFPIATMSQDNIELNFKKG